MKIDQEKIAILVERAQKGDVDAFSEVYDFFLESVYRFMFFRVSVEQEAEDLTSEVFLKAWRALKKYQHKQGMPFSAWLFRIAHNELVDFFRTKKQIDELSEEDPLPDLSMDSVRDIENVLERKRLQSALKKLPKAQSDVIILKFKFWCRHCLFDCRCKKQASKGSIAVDVCMKIGESKI